MNLHRGNVKRLVRFLLKLAMVDPAIITQHDLRDRVGEVRGAGNPRVALHDLGAGSGLETSSLLYLAAILLVLGLIANLIAQVIVRRFDPLRGAR